MAEETINIPETNSGDTPQEKTASFSGFLHYKQTVTDIITDLRKLREFSTKRH